MNSPPNQPRVSMVTFNQTVLSPLIPPESDEAALEFIEDITTNAKAVQEKLLSEIVTQNAHTEYLKAFHLHQDTDQVEAFKSRVPIVGYDDLQPLIRRIADGDTSPVLSAQPISEFLLSSGSSGGEPKVVPATEESLSHGILLLYLIRALINKHVEGLEKGRGLYFLCTRPETKTKGGITTKPITTSLYKSEMYKNLHSNAFIGPIEAIHCTDTYQSTYAQMLCGLYDRGRVLHIGSTFATNVLRAIKFLQSNWQLLTHDICTGTLNSKITDTLLRECMIQVMRPDPMLADRVACECANNTWEGIIPRIWPNTKFIRATITGTMSQHIPSLDYYSGGLPIVSPIYATSETYVGINLNPTCNPSQVSYTIMPNMAYFEFLPHNPDSLDLDSHEQLVDLVNVEIDKEYEIVVTTHAGLNRYRIGDILRVTGFYNSAPQFQFVGRKNVLLSIDVEKTNEVELQAAIAKASQLLDEFNTSVVDYTSYADNGTVPGHYVIYCELLVSDSGHSPSDKDLQRCCLEMEELLNFMYRRLRCFGSIGPLEIRVLKNGTFENLTDFVLSRSPSIGQYKMPRCTRDQQIIQFLNTRVISANFSPSLPDGFGLTP